MTKEVLISIVGLHTGIDSETGKTEPVEVVTPGTYYFKNGKHYILFEEVIEGMPGSIKNTIKITGDKIFEIRKSGITSAKMEFEKDHMSLSNYQTPFGDMQVGIQTRDIKVDVQEDLITVKIFYLLDVNNEPLSECKIEVKVKSLKKQENS